MNDPRTLALAAALLFFAIGAAVVILTPYLRRPSARPKAEAGGAAIEENCRACRKVMVLHRNTLSMLTAAEKGLAVSARPDLRGKALGRFVCPYCDAAHYYIVERSQLTFAGTNFYEPQDHGAVCMACQKPLVTPPWPESAYDGRVDDAPVKSPDHGLICSRCHAVCCVACCEAVTKGNARAEGLICPRCGRRPVDRFFYP